MNYRQADGIETAVAKVNAAASELLDRMQDSGMDTEDDFIQALIAINDRMRLIKHRAQDMAFNDRGPRR